MKKVMQTVAGLGGNCEGATIATLLGLNIEDIPSFGKELILKLLTLMKVVVSQENLNSFLRQHGYRMLNLGVTKNPKAQDINWVIKDDKTIGAKHLVAGISHVGICIL